MLRFQIHTTDVAQYLAVLLRLSLVVFLVPPFNSERVSARIKGALALTASTLLFIPLHNRIPPLSFDHFALLETLVGEFLFAMVFALSTATLMATFQFAGDLVSYQTGFSIAQVVDPQSSAQITLFSNIMQLLAILIFLGINGHHVILQLLVESYRTLPVGQFLLQLTTLERIVQMVGHLFVIAVKIATPVLLVLFLIQVGLGVVSKFVPNINILVTSFPLTIIAGFFFTGLALPFWSDVLVNHFRQLFGFMQTFVMTP
jgi:flagellar biosynthesis protein FliR